MPEFVNPFVGMVPGRKLTKGELLRAIRLSLAAEEEATHIYMAIAEAAEDELAKAVLRDIANEERVHKGEFQRLIEILAPDEGSFMEEGAAEVNELRDSLPGVAKAGNSMATVGDLKSEMTREGGAHA